MDQRGETNAGRQISQGQEKQVERCGSSVRHDEESGQKDLRLSKEKVRTETSLLLQGRDQLASGAS